MAVSKLNDSPAVHFVLVTDTVYENEEMVVAVNAIATPMKRLSWM